MRLPHLLSHICAPAPGDAEDMAPLYRALEGRQVEFAAQRTMCADQTLCWQSLRLPVLVCAVPAPAKSPKRGSGIELTLTVAYDPPGFLPDIAESLGLSRRFKRELDVDFRRYVHALQMNCVSELASVD